MADLIIEILSEEIPASMQENGILSFKKFIEGKLKDLSIDITKSDYFYTPRRLTYRAYGLPITIPETKELKKGPRVGAPDKALDGFLKATHITKDKLIPQETEKGEFYFVETINPEQKIKDILADLIPQAISQINWPKSMKWSSYSTRFVRPIRHILCLFNNETLESSFQLSQDKKLDFSNYTYGHRFLANEKITIKNVDEYEEVLKKSFVLVSQTEREKSILEACHSLAKKQNLVFHEDINLLKEVTGLVEYPVPLVGTIDDDFLSLPKEVLSKSMKSHQKYFPLYQKNGEIASKFIIIANIETKNTDQVVNGYERVLRARLADAKFFWEQDQKTPLENRVDKLKTVIFHQKIGTVFEKINRIKDLAVFLTKYIRNAKNDDVEKAAYLAKADLTTLMVQEFPELQGIIGSYYASNEGYNTSIATAIKDHYRPQGPHDKCPNETTSALVSLADKLDSLFWLFAAGEKPTGSKDPYALRRTALGIIRIVIENKLYIALSDVFNVQAQQNSSLKLDHDKIDIIKQEISAFIFDRLKVYLKDKSYTHDHISAVIERKGEDNIYRIVERIEALEEFLNQENGKSVLTSFKRANNILSKEEKKGNFISGDVSFDIFEQDEEIKLFETLQHTESQLNTLLEKDEFEKAMDLLAGFKKPIDLFFETVIVNCDDEKLKDNRLKLLSKFKNTLQEVINFEKIEG